MKTISADQFKEQYGTKTYSQFGGETQKPGLIQRVGQDIQEAGNKVADTYQQGASGQISPLRAATGVVASAFNAVPKVASDVLPEPVRKGIDVAGKGIGKGLQWLAEKTTPQFMVDFVTKHPDAAKMLENAAGTLSNTGQIAGDILATDQFAKNSQKGIDLTKQAAQKAGQAIQGTAEAVGQKVRSIPDQIKGTYKNPETFTRDLVTPELKGKDLLKAVKSGKVVEGQGLIGKRDISGSVNNLDDLEGAVKSVPGISPAKTNLENLNAIHQEIGRTADDLEGQVASEKSFFSPNKFKNVMNGARERLGEDPNLVGDAAKSSDRVISKFEQLVKQEGYNPKGLLQARKLLDNWIAKYKPNAFSPATETGITSAIREIRQTGNKFLADISPNSAVKALLEHQTNLYRAIDNIAPKAVGEGSTMLSQIVKAHPIASSIMKTAGRMAGMGAAVRLGEDFIP